MATTHPINNTDNSTTAIWLAVALLLAIAIAAFAYYNGALNMATSANLNTPAAMEPAAGDTVIIDRSEPAPATNQ